MSKNNDRYFLFLMIIALFLSSCGQPGQDKSSGTGADSSNAPFTKAVIKYARGFRIDYSDHYKTVSIYNRAGDKTDTIRYLLLPAGQTAPQAWAGIPAITIPVKSLVVMSSSHVGMAEFAGIADRITGLGSLKYINSPLVRQGISKGTVKEIGIDNAMNTELLISMHPGVLLTMSNPDAATGKNKTLADAGVPLIPVGEWLETTALGRAEWVKLIAALANREDLVNPKFDSLEQAYRQLAALGSKASDKPSVIVSMPYKSDWFMPAGESYQAELLHNAGTAYHWGDTKGTGSLSLNFEAVAPEALKADYWINVGTVDSKADVIAKDARFAQFHSFQAGSIYNNTLRTNDLGSNDYWESGTMHPQLILADLIRIFHPGLLPKDTLFYYKQLK